MVWLKWWCSIVDVLYTAARGVCSFFIHELVRPRWSKSWHNDAKNMAKAWRQSKNRVRINWNHILHFPLTNKLKYKSWVQRGFRCLLVSRAQLYIVCLYKEDTDPTLWGQRFKLYYQLVPVSPSPLPSRSFLVSKEDKNAPYLKCSEFFVPRSNDEIHGMCDSEGMGPVVVWNISIILLHGKHKPPQFVNSKSIT